MRYCQGYQDVIDLIGADAAMMLVASYGGTVLEIPARPKDDNIFSELRHLIGERAARELIHTYANLHLPVPLLAAAERARRDAAIAVRFDALIARGLSARKAVTHLAREFGKVESTIWRSLKRAPEPTVRKRTP